MLFIYSLAHWEQNVCSGGGGIFNNFNIVVIRRNFANRQD